jgi:hypothetical protein
METIQQKGSAHGATHKLTLYAPSFSAYELWMVWSARGQREHGQMPSAATAHQNSSHFAAVPPLPFLSAQLITRKVERHDIACSVLVGGQLRAVRVVFEFEFECQSLPYLLMLNIKEDEETPSLVFVMLRTSTKCGPRMCPSLEDFVTLWTLTKCGPIMCLSLEDFVTLRTSTKYGPILCCGLKK